MSYLNFRLLGIIRLVYPKPALPCRIILTFKFPLKLQMSIKTKKGGQSASLNVNKFKLSFVLTCRKQFALSLARFFISAFYILLFLLFIFFFLAGVAFASVFSPRFESATLRFSSSGASPLSVFSP